MLHLAPVLVISLVHEETIIIESVNRTRFSCSRCDSAEKAHNANPKTEEMPSLAHPIGLPLRGLRDYMDQAVGRVRPGAVGLRTIGTERSADRHRTPKREKKMFSQRERDDGTLRLKIVESPKSALWDSLGLHGGHHMPN